MTQWIVLLDTAGIQYPYGPIDDEDTAHDFAAFLTAEVDPAVAIKLCSPTRELLTFWKRNEEHS